MMGLALAALIFGFFCGVSIKWDKPCKNSVVIEHLSPDDADFLERGRAEVDGMKAINKAVGAE